MKEFYTVFLFLVFLNVLPPVQAQPPDTLKVKGSFSGTASITNNGISLVPSFSLGKPALLFDLKFRKDRFSFEPDMRFALEGKPWSFLFWFRYQAIEKERFSLRLGAHPAMNFRTVNVVRDGREEEIIEARRYAAVELVPNFQLTKKISVGIYYLYGRGFDAGVKETNFVVFNTNFNNLPVFKDFYLNISPQAYYLTSDELRGTYTALFLSFFKNEFPLGLSAILNKAMETEIIPEDDFVWNISLVYRFN